MRSLSLELAEQKLRAAMDAGDLRAMDAWAELVDMLDELARRPTPTLADAARWYGSLGLKVFPLTPRSKVPLKGTHGLHDASSDHLQIAGWWGMRPDCNVGIATGHLVDVLDIDGVEGQVSLSQLIGWDEPDIDERGTPARMLSSALGIVSTPRAGGVHLFYPASGQGNTTGLLPHIDRRGVGGYVVAPPSIVETPDVSGVYEWVRLLDVSALTRA